MNIQQTIAKAHYVATEAQVEDLAVAQWQGASVLEVHNATYGRVILAQAQAKTGTKARGRHSKDSQLAVLLAVNTLYYAAVLRGLVKADPTIAADGSLEPAERSRRALERNRRSTYARTAYRELVGFVERGGDLRTLDVETVSKASLRNYGKPTESENRTERTLERAQGAILRAINRLARGDPTAAVERLDAIMVALQARRHELGNKAPIRHGKRQGREGPAIRTRVGVPQFHRPGAQ